MASQPILSVSMKTVTSRDDFPKPKERRFVIGFGPPASSKPATSRRSVLVAALPGFDALRSNWQLSRKLTPQAEKTTTTKRHPRILLSSRFWVGLTHWRVES